MASIDDSVPVIIPAALMRNEALSMVAKLIVIYKLANPGPETAVSLADLLGTNRERTGRALHNLAAEGLAEQQMIKANGRAPKQMWIFLFDDLNRSGVLPQRQSTAEAKHDSGKMPLRQNASGGLNTGSEGAVEEPSPPTALDRKEDVNSSLVGGGAGEPDNEPDEVGWYDNEVVLDEADAFLDFNAYRRPAAVTSPVAKKQSRPRTNYSYSGSFEEAWKAYHRKGSKQGAFREWQLAIQRVDPEIILAAIPKYLAANPVVRYRKDFERWLKGDMWEAEMGPELNALGLTKDDQRYQGSHDAWAARAASWTPEQRRKYGLPVTDDEEST